MMKTSPNPLLRKEGANTLYADASPLLTKEGVGGGFNS